MNVLVLTQYFWPESFRINEVVKSLVATDCRITVLTGQPNYPDGVVFRGYSAISISCETHELGYSVYRVPMIPRGAATSFRLVINYLSFIVSATLLAPWLLRHKKFDVVFVYAPSPILQAIPAIWLKWLKKTTLVIWVQDLWPQSLEVTGFVRNRYLLRLVEKVVRWIYRQSDLLMVQSRAFVASVRAMSGGVTVEYLPNPGEAAFLETSPARTPALVLREGFNVVFAGNLGTAQALDTLLGAAELLRVEPAIRFVLVGSGSCSEWLKQEINRRGLQNVALPGRFSPVEMPGILAQASVLLVSLARSPTMSQTVPTKIQAYLAAGRPIIASLDGEGARIVTEAGAGIACPAEDADALADAVLTLQSMSSEQLRQIGEQGRRYYMRHFDSYVVAQRLLECLRTITLSRGSSHIERSDE